MNKQEIIENFITSLEKKKSISKKELSECFDENKISLLIIDDIIDEMINQGFSIIDNESAIKSKKSRVKERTISYQKQREEILKLSEESAKKQFLTDLENAKIQSTYIPLVVLGFLNDVDCNGVISIYGIIEYYKEFFKKRYESGSVIERKDSIFSQRIPENREIKALILFNPLGRSFLVKYFKYNKEDETVAINENLWKSLSAANVSYIRVMSKQLINEYYRKLEINT